jgi:hypothetical protein
MAAASRPMSGLVSHGRELRPNQSLKLTCKPPTLLGFECGEINLQHTIVIVIRNSENKNPTHWNVCTQLSSSPLVGGN